MCGAVTAAGTQSQLKGSGHNGGCCCLMLVVNQINGHSLYRFCHLSSSLAVDLSIEDLLA